MKQELNPAKSTLQEIEDAARQIEKGIRIIRLLRRCPVCHKCEESTGFSQRDNDCYARRCAGCETTWATRIDRSGKRYPVLIPDGKLVDKKGRAVDRLYGADLLAIPDGKGGFWH